MALAPRSVLTALSSPGTAAGSQPHARQPSPAHINVAARPPHRKCSNALPLLLQVNLMSDTSILISPCGGLATVLTFMRPGATGEPLQQAATSAVASRGLLLSHRRWPTVPAPAQRDRQEDPGVATCTGYTEHAGREL